MAKTFLPDLILDKPLRLFPNLWSNFFDESALPSLNEDFTFRGVKIYEEDNHLHVELPLPGLNLNDIEVSLNKGILFIKGEKKEEEKDKKRKFYRFSSRNYSSSIPLPTQIDEKQEPEAVYENGILNVTLKLANHGETKKIKVKEGKNNKK